MLALRKAIVHISGSDMFSTEGLRRAIGRISVSPRLVRGFQSRSRSIGCSALRCHESRDPRERSQIVKVDVVDLDSQAEALLELHEQLHELERVQNARL